MVRILVVEDDIALNKMICAKLQQESFDIYPAYDGEEAIEQLESIYVDLIICDIMMPRLNGYEFVKVLRQANMQVPVLMITAKETIEDMEKGFQVGTDDYMVKPINLREMVLRIRALLRRSQIATEKRLVIGNTILDYEALTVTTKEKTLELPPKEFYLLFKLLSHPDKIFTRLDLLDAIWGLDSEVDERTVDSHIKKIRRKFEDSVDFQIVTIRGLGYKAKKGAL